MPTGLLGVALRQGLAGNGASICNLVAPDLADDLGTIHEERSQHLEDDQQQAGSEDRCQAAFVAFNELGDSFPPFTAALDECLSPLEEQRLRIRERCACAESCQCSIHHWA